MKINIPRDDIVTAMMGLRLLTEEVECKTEYGKVADRLEELLHN